MEDPAISLSLLLFFLFSSLHFHSWNSATVELPNENFRSLDSLYSHFFLLKCLFFSSFPFNHSKYTGSLFFKMALIYFFLHKKLSLLFFPLFTAKCCLLLSLTVEVLLPVTGCEFLSMPICSVANLEHREAFQHENLDFRA